MKNFKYSVLALFIVFLVWQGHAVRTGIPEIFPYPHHVIERFTTLLFTRSTYATIFNTLGRLFTALIIATITGIILGSFSGLSSKISAFFSPLTSALRTIPVASVIVVILIIYGAQRSLYIITFLMIFPLIFEATKQGVLNIDQTLKEALMLEEKNIVYSYTNIYLPLAYPFIKTGFLQSIGLGFKVLVMAEFIAQRQNSIGYALYLGRVNFAYVDVFAWTFIIIILVIIIEVLINRINAKKNTSSV